MINMWWRQGGGHHVGANPTFQSTRGTRRDDFLNRCRRLLEDYEEPNDDDVAAQPSWTRCPSAVKEEQDVLD